MSEFETDQEPGAEHPRRTHGLYGHEAEERLLADALNGARPHHAWMLTGPKGIGKATLAYRAVRRLMGARMTGPRPLAADPADPIVRRIEAGAHPDVLVIRRGLNDKGKPRREITAGEARALSGFFALQPAEGGWRAAIIDAADDLNRTAANAILKSLEEPPAKAMIFLICHKPGALLATIRSRVRRLALRPLPEAQMAAAVGGQLDPAALRLGQGRPGRALALAGLRAGEAEASLQAGLAALAKGRPAGLLQLGQGLSGAQAELRAGLLIGLMQAQAARLALVSHGLETPIADWEAKLSQGPGAARWASAYGALSALEQEWSGLDMDANLAVSRAAGLIIEATA